MKFLINFTGIVLLVLMLASCVPFKEVGTFTASSQKSLQGVQLPYGSYKYCEDSCYIYNKQLHSLQDLKCNRSRDSLRDTVILNEFAILGSYYAALTKLSGVSLINFGPLAKNVKKGTYGKFITITDDEATTFTNLSGAITSLVTLDYKSKKLKEFIGDNDPAVQHAILALSIQLANLRTMVKNMKGAYHDAIRDDLNVAGDQSERLLLITIYKQKTDELNDAEGNYIQMQKVLSKIADGETLLKLNVENLKSENFKKSILNIAGDIIYLNSKSN